MKNEKKRKEYKEISWRLFASKNRIIKAYKRHLPSRFEISELCIFGFSWAIFLRCNRDHTMNAFIGRFMWSSTGFFIACDNKLLCQKEIYNERKMIFCLFKLKKDTYLLFAPFMRATFWCKLFDWELCKTDADETWRFCECRLSELSEWWWWCDEALPKCCEVGIDNGCDKDKPGIDNDGIRSIIFAYSGKK